MTVNNIGKTFSDGTLQGPYPYRRRGGHKFDESLLPGTAAGKWEALEEGTAVNPKAGCKHAAGYQIGMERRFGEIGASDPKVGQENSGEETRGARACEVRHISCGESDFFKVCAMEGYSLKAKVFSEDGKVYLEQKFEDGKIRAYEFDVKQISEGTQDVLEQAAWEAWMEAEASGQQEQTDFHGAMLAFYEKVREQIRNGPPKFQTGGEEFSEEEWKRLVEELDTYLEEVRKEQSERMEKQEKEDAVSSECMEKQQKEDAVSRELIEKLLEDRDRERTGEIRG